MQLNETMISHKFMLAIYEFMIYHTVVVENRRKNMTPHRAADILVSIRLQYIIKSMRSQYEISYFIGKEEKHLTLKERRIAANLRQEDVANELEVSQSVVCRWEQGSKPLPKYQRKLAALFGCAVEEIIQSIEN